MRPRRRPPAAGAILAALLLLLASVAPAESDSDLRCRRVALVDAETGAPVRGAEDLAVDRRRGWLYLSAFDRWALADALDSDRERLPGGGIYAAPLDAVADAAARLPVRRLTGVPSPDLHPHGIALYDDSRTARLFAVNHAYVRDAGRWRRRTRIDVFEPHGDTLRPTGRIAHAALCRANDLVALSTARLLVSRDHGACRGAARWLEDLLGLRRAEVLRVLRRPGEAAQVATLVDGIGFANGVALDPTRRHLAVAATREGRVRIHDLEALAAGRGRVLRAVTLDGGPDNLTWTPDGRVLAAVHASLLDAGMALGRWLGARRAGSRVVAIDPRTGARATLLDDPDGTMLNMATVAVAFGETLVVGAVLDDAVLVCPDEAR